MSHTSEWDALKSKWPRKCVGSIHNYTTANSVKAYIDAMNPTSYFPTRLKTKG